MHGRYDVASSPSIFGSLLVSALNDLVRPLSSPADRFGSGQLRFSAINYFFFPFSLLLLRNNKNLRGLLGHPGLVGGPVITRV